MHIFAIRPCFLRMCFSFTQIHARPRTAPSTPGRTPSAADRSTSSTRSRRRAAAAAETTGRHRTAAAAATTLIATTIASVGRRHVASLIDVVRRRAAIATSMDAVRRDRAANAIDAPGTASSPQRASLFGFLGQQSVFSMLWYHRTIVIYMLCLTPSPLPATVTYTVPRDVAFRTKRSTLI